ncbi:hypothetical protein BH09PLA1_BH09PLA1_03940 [soil metagenome]
MTGSLNLMVVALTVLLSAEPTTQPEWREKFDAVYGLAPTEILKHIPPPFIDERMEFYAATMPELAAALPGSPDHMIINWDSSPHLWICSGPDGSGIPFTEALTWVTQLRRHELDLSPELAAQSIPGDWVVRKGAEPAKLLEAFIVAASTAKECRIVATQETIEMESIVAKGNISQPKERANQSVMLPLESLQLLERLRGTGQRKLFYEQLSRSTGYPVIDVDEGGPAGAFFDWGCAGHPLPPTRGGDRISRVDLDVLLESISAQTPLTFTIEPRKIAHWLISSAK